MNVDAENFVRLMSSYLNGDSVQLEKPNWEEIYKISMLHNVTGMLYAAICNEEIDNSQIKEKLGSVFANTVKYSMIQEINLQKLIDNLNKNKIKHILFKGAVIKKYYPDEELRTMGDIDVAIDAEDREIVHDILVKDGYLYDEKNSHNSVRNYIKNNVCFEIHTEILEKNLFEDIDYVDYFSHKFDNAFLKDGFTYEFKYEYHFLYVMVHMAKHFRFSGCGVRMIMDAAVFAKKHINDMNWKYIENELSYLGLAEFSAVVFKLCRMWFNVNVPIAGKEKNVDLIAIVEDYIIDGGVFGYDGKNVDALMLSQDNGSTAGKVKKIAEMCFPRYEHLKRRYTWFEKYPKWLLPLGWLKYWQINIIKGNGIERVKNMFKGQEDADLHKKLLEVTGLSGKKG